MRIPVVRGVIDRRLLVNYRVDPEVLASLVPPPFRPQKIRGVGMVGICLIRLRDVRPAILPSWLGTTSENAAHRTAVEWERDGTTHRGVYIRRRDTNSRLNACAGGRLFPGIHHHAAFEVSEADDRYSIELRSDDGETCLSVCARLADRFPESSVFRSLEEASAFFRGGAIGYSTTSDPNRFQGLELRCEGWKVEPLDVEEARSSFFDDTTRFPPGSIELDGALLMRGIAHEWHGKPDLCCTETAAVGSPLPAPGVP